MYTLARLFTSPTAGALILLGFLSCPANADDLVQNRGPVGPDAPILTTVGNKRVIAFYSQDGGRCNLNAVVWTNADVEAHSAARFRVQLGPNHTVQVESPDHELLSLRCGDNAETLQISDATNFVAAGVAR